MYRNLQPADGCRPISTPEADRCAAVRCGWYHIGPKALYYSSGRYVPRSEITSVALITQSAARIRNTLIGLPRPAVAVTAGKKKYVLLAGTRREVRAILDELAPRKADLTENETGEME